MLRNRDDNCIKQERESEGRGSLTASLNGAIDGMAKTLQARKALWVVSFVLVIAALVFGVRLTYSAFSANDHLKAVAVTGTSQSLFASDVLAPYSEKPAEPMAKSVVVDTGKSDATDANGTWCSFTFRVYNCMLDDRNVFNDKDVKYALSVSAVSVNGNDEVTSGWSISPAQGDVVLPGTQAKIVTYTISFDKILLNNVAFKIFAIVDQTNSPGTNLACLAATVTPAERSVVESASVTGAWADTGDVGDYAAYNYRVSVTGKQQTVTLKWAEKVELDPYFEKNHAGENSNCTVNTDERTATFTMSPGSEIVNFYWTGGSAGPSEWSDLGVSVTASG
ncbi:hypothetical protein [uncultured Senegalimassilia sp.]|uniref:hypothetical protein n=1 Tax=uncultured Senegalimassilia sp. TaxID=1714350 RepID=UPI0025F772FA|nr:hypothetical protein [uncultured Senegalimassilia sp.]